MILFLLIIAIFLFFFLTVFTFIKEATAEIVVRLGAFHKVLMAWRDHDIDKDYNVILVPGKKRLLGGLAFVGWRFLDKLYTYVKRWRTHHLVKDKEEPQIVFYEESLVSIPLQPTSYITLVKDAETKMPERIRLTLYVVYIYQIVNVYKPFFVAPLGYHEKFEDLINASLVRFVSRRDSNGILAAISEAEELYNEVKDDPAIKDAQDNWGLEIKKIRIIMVTWPPEYQEALAAKSKKEMEATGRAEEIMGTVILAVARAEGKTENDIQLEFRKDPKAFYEKHRTIVDNTMTKLSMEEKAYLRMETPGATAFGGEFLRLIGAWLRMPMGGKGKEKKEEKERKEEIHEETREEKIKRVKETLKKG